MDFSFQGEPLDDGIARIRCESLTVLASYRVGWMRHIFMARVSWGNFSFIGSELEKNVSADIKETSIVSLISPS